jgi:Cytochrome P450
MLIPKGSMVFLAIFAMHHNEGIYSDHDTFNPDRYLNHPKLANEYAVGPDYNNRDKYYPTPLAIYGILLLIIVHTTMDTALDVGSAQVCT